MVVSTVVNGFAGQLIRENRDGPPEKGERQEADIQDFPFEGQTS